MAQKIYRMRVEEWFLKKAQKHAESEQRSLASLIRFLLTKHMEKAGK